ncbi:MAG: TonB-dependent receptor plug domain-containing protein [Bacteroidia bacterium]|jgi:hypothetical protein|nr:TonB-dependent receptor plug domain-containing protein [Bacteroidia bacterium]
MDRVISSALLVWVCFISSTIHAQQDSLVSQFWGRNPNANVESTTSNQVQIITKEQILYSGYSLVSDVLQLIDGWTMSTYNGDKWNVQSNATGNYQSQNWTLMLDGARIELLQLDAQHINTLGIGVRDIERIEVVNIAGNYLGEWNDKGIIHIITKRNTEGFTYRSFISNGNEIGDPHLQVNSNSSLNVHGYGTSFSNFIGYKRKRLSIELNQYYNDYFYRDTSVLMWPLILANNPNADFVLKLLNGRFLLAYSGNKATHQLTFIANRGNDVVLPAGFLTPQVTDNQFYIAAYNFRYVLGKGILQYRTSFTQRKLRDYSILFLNHNQNYLTQNVNYTLTKLHSNGKRIAQFGLAHEWIETQSATTFTNINNQQNLIRPYFSYTYPLTKKSNFFTDVSVLATSKVAIPKVVVGYYKQPSIIANWSVVGSYSQRSLVESNDYFQLLALNNANALLQTSNVSSLASLDYYFNLNVNKYFKVSFNSGLKYLIDELYIHPALLSLSNNALFQGSKSMVIRDQTRWLNRINVHYNMLKSTRFDVNYLRIGALSGVEEENSLPKHRLSLVVTQTLPSRFYVWVRYYHQSATYWINPQYTTLPANTAVEDQFVKVKGMHTMDAGITKKLFKEYLVANVSVRNIFNTTERYQAMGATFYMRLFVSVNLNIDGVFAKSTSKP